MKILTILALAAAFVGCTTAPTTSTTTTTSAVQTNPQKRVYSHDDLERSGRSTTGGALRTIDPSVSAPGS